MKPVDAEIKDIQLVEKAGFQHEVAFVAKSLISSLHFLKKLAAKRGIPMEQITTPQIIQEFQETFHRMK